MSKESPFLGLSSVLNKISQTTLPFNSRPSQTSKNIGVLRALSTFSYWKSQLNTITVPKFLKKPTIKDKPDSNCLKYTKKPSHIFIKKAHSLGQSYVCLGLIKPNLWTNIGTCLPA